MSSALVPSNGSPNFAQQGSVDWISLSNSTLSFSVEVLSRFSKAGVEMVTVAIGQALFSNYNIPPEGQKRFSDAVSKLRAFSSCGTVLWFGFGVKHVVRTLCETEQGATCAAICACLSVSYDSFYSSQVLKELVDASLTPTTLKPALSQWNALVNVCAGAVTDSQFPMLVEGFSSLVGFPSKDRKLHPLQQPTTAKALAGALLELSKVSNGTTRSVTFEGGVDCGWIAAVAQWLLGLRVEIFDASGDRLYSNTSINSDVEPQVIILRSSPSDGVSTSVSRRSFIVPPGALSFNLHHERLSEDSTQHFYSNGRSKWTNILRDTFGSSIDDLLTKNVAPKFAEFICRMFKYPTEFRKASRCQEHRNIEYFLSFAIERLPELERLRQVTDEDPKFYDKVEAMPTGARTYFNNLKEFCQCEDCALSREQAPIPVFERPPETICLERVATTIFDFLWTLSWLDLHESINPSSSGLLIMYYSRRNEALREDTLKDTVFDRGIGKDLFSLFTGLTATNQIYPKTLSAASESGICIHQQTLTSLYTLPLQNLRLHVLPGQIQFNERIYTQVLDHGEDSAKRLLQPPSSLIQSVGFEPVLDLFVEETISSSQLRAKFLVQRQILPAGYLDYLSHLQKVSDGRWNISTQPNLYSVGPGSLWRNIKFRMRSSSCCHDKFEVSLVQPRSLQPTRLWTGDCSLAAQSLRINPDVAQCIPEDEEWLLVDTSETTPYAEIVRGKFPFIYYVVSHLSVSSQVRLMQPSVCFICMAFSGKYKEFRIVVHSFLDDTKGTAVELICRRMSQTPNEVPIDLAPSLPLPTESIVSPKFSAPTRRPRKRKNRK